MIKYLSSIAVLLFLFSTPAFAHYECNSLWTGAVENDLVSIDYQDLVGTCDEDLLEEISMRAAKGQRSLSYDKARLFMFSKLDNFGGKVCSVYDIDECIRTKGIPNPNIINCEHTWPKSLGASSVPAKSDLHHLYPTNSRTNSRRSSYPFCEVSTIIWENGTSKLGTNDKGYKCFEPPVEHRGNVARSLFYFAARYNKRIDQSEENFLRKWHNEDPVDAAELERHSEIVKKQKNVNPFILQPYLVDLIADF